MGTRSQHTATLRHRTRGGLLPLRVLRVLAETAESKGAGRLRLTARQEVDVPGVDPACLDKLAVRLPGEALHCPAPQDEPNIVTTAPVAGMAPGRPWLVEGVFQDILGDIACRPVFPVSLGDPTQPYLPDRCGVLDFLAAEEEHRWHVAIKLPGCDGGPVFPGECASADVAWIVEKLCRAWPLDDPQDPRAALHDLLGPRLRATGGRPPSQAPCFEAVPDAVNLPMPEGGWPAAFVEALCVWTGNATDVTFRATQWRTLLLPGLDAEQRQAVAHLCLGHGVPFVTTPWRAYLWAADEQSAAAEALAKALDARCPANPGYGIAVAGIGDSVPDLAIRVEQGHKSNWLPFRREKFRFVVNGTQHAWTGPAEAADAIVRSLAEDTATAPQPPATAPATESNTTLNAGNDDGAHACRECATTYQPAYGDPLGAVPVGTPFDALPETWVCPVCGGPRSGYAPLHRQHAA